MISRIKEIARRINPEVIGWRRWLHQHPELSQEEYGTMAFVAERLREMGLEPKTGIGKTGCMAILKGEGRTEKGERRGENGEGRAAE